MNVFGFLPLKRLFPSEMEENYTWCNAAFGQVQTPFANFIFCQYWRACTHIYTCTLCVAKSVFRLVRNLTCSYNLSLTNLYKTNDFMWWLISWNSALTHAQCNLLIPAVSHWMCARLSAWFLWSVIWLWINRFEPYFDIFWPFFLLCSLTFFSHYTTFSNDSKVSAGDGPDDLEVIRRVCKQR